MHITLILLAAAGQVVTALEPHFTNSPRGTTSDDNLATITALSDGHLPTCFTGHPTYPCPTNGPQGKRDMMDGLAGNPMGGLTDDINEAARIVPIEQIELTASGGKPSLPTDAPKVKARDASPEVANKDYIPEPNEWAIPGKFKFTDSIDHNATGTTASAVSLTTSCSDKNNIASSTAAIPQSSDHVDRYAHHHHNIHHNNQHDNQRAGANAYVHTSAISESVTAKAYSQTTDPPALPSALKEQHAVVNASSEVHVAASIGSLLSAAMFPGKMRAPTNTNISPYAAAVTASKGAIKVDDKLDAYSTTQLRAASISTPCDDSESSSSRSTGPAYNVKPITMVTSLRPAVLSEAQQTASYKAAEPALLQHTAKHFVS